MRNLEVRNQQSEVTECGLASIAMAAGLLGSNIDLPYLRQHYPVSVRGTTLPEMIEIAAAVGLSARAVRCDVEELPVLQLPSILHWEMNHFVVLVKNWRSKFKIFDPAVGYRVVKHREINRSFTGVALEISSVPQFEAPRPPPPLRLLSLVRWTSQIKGGMFHAVIMSMLLQAYVMISPFFMQIAIDDVSTNGDINLLITLGIGFGVFAIFNACAEWLRTIISQRLATLLGWDMTKRFFHHMIHLPLPWFQRRRLADAQSRLQSLDPIKNIIANGIVTALIDGVLSLSTLLLMFVFSPILAFISVVSFFTYALVRIISLPIARRRSSESLIASIAEQGKRLETFRAIQTIKVMGGESQRENEWSNKFADMVKANQGTAMVGAFFATTQKLLDTLVNIIIVCIGVYFISRGKMTVGALYAFLAYRAQFYARSTSLFDFAINWRMLDIYTYRIADVALSPVEDISSKPSPSGKLISGKIDVEGLAFRYSPTDKYIFEGVNFSIAAGEFVAIVGPSGVGKSTLLKVLCGLYPATRGGVFIDGISANEWGVKALRRSLGVVMQDDELLPGTISENVSFFAEQIDTGWMWSCLEVAGISEEVRSLPMRADTFVGDMGANLSGGQQQRILLARALYRRPRILILDEATSHLDFAREVQINKNIGDMRLTRIVVAHRMETIAAADRIILLEKGGSREISLEEALGERGSGIRSSRMSVADV